MSETIKNCRKCSDCQGGSEHHWMQNLEADHVCKHCGALGLTCEECGGDGCEHCHDEGVFLVAPALERTEELARAAAALLREADDDGITQEGVTRLIEAIQQATGRPWRVVAKEPQEPPAGTRRHTL